MFCSVMGRYICSTCLAKMKTLSEEYCVVCGKESENGITHSRCRSSGTPSQLYSAFEYTSLVRAVIKRSKYKSKEFLGLKIITELAAELCKEELSKFTSYVVIPIPVSAIRLKDRGFNQVETIVKVISKRNGNKVKLGLLKRITDSIAQYSNTRKERFANVSGVFEVEKSQKNLVADQKFLLVDDICTSGATLLEASKVLYKYGAKDVKCFALSKKL